MSKMTADGEIDNKNFVERVAAMSNKKIIDWKEFFKDENGFIWFFYAKSIYIRKSRFEGIAEGFIAESSSEAKVKFK